MHSEIHSLWWRGRGKAVQILLAVVLIAFACPSSLTAQSAGEGPWTVDKATPRLKELTIGFLLLHGESTHEIASGLGTGVFNATDRILIERAVTDYSYYQESLALSKTACEQFQSTDSQEADVEYFAGLLSQASWSGYQRKEEFLEASYLAMSSAARNRFDELLVEGAQVIAEFKDLSDDMVRRLRDIGRERALVHIADMCERLPLAFQMFSDSD